MTLAVQPDRLPAIGVYEDVPPSLERLMEPVARRAQGGDRAARDELYFALEPKLLASAGRIPVPFAPRDTCGIWDRNDMRQEAYLVFLDIIDTCPADIPFGRYALGNFRWRLRDAASRKLGRRGIPPRSASVSAEGMADWLADDSWRTVESEALIEAIASTLERPLDGMLRLHIIEGESITATAVRLGISRRTATSYWGRIVAQLRAGITPNIQTPNPVCGGDPWPE